MAFAFFWNAPKSKNFIFGSFSVFKLITCFFYAPLSYVRNFWNAPFFPFSESKIRKWGIKKARDQFKNRKGTENEIHGFWGISKNENAITWQNHLSHAFWCISYYEGPIFGAEKGLKEFIITCWICFENALLVQIYAWIIELS